MRHIGGAVLEKILDPVEDGRRKRNHESQELLRCCALGRVLSATV